MTIWQGIVFVFAMLAWGRDLVILYNTTDAWNKTKIARYRLHAQRAGSFGCVCRDCRVQRYELMDRD